MKHTAISIEGLCKTYRGGLFGRSRVDALRDVSFSVEPGSIFGLLGPNGAGKTTLIKILLGLVFKTRGRASLLGHRAGDLSGRQAVGYLPESHRIPRHLTGSSALRYYGGLSGMSPGQVRRAGWRLLDRVGLGEWGATSVRKYSKGMLQRLGLAQAMLHNPQLLILDEPTDGVDPVGRSEMRALLQELKDEGKTIFINSHLLQEVELVCDRVAILVQGSLRRVGSVKEITARQLSDVVMQLAGPESAIRECLQAADILSWRPEGADRVAVTLRAPDQQQINASIDRLRAREIDIVGISRLQDSLEEAFLDIVASEQTPVCTS